MKTNYKPNDKVIVSNPSHFASGLPGTVISNNLDTKFKPVSVILDNGLGTWQMNYTDIEPATKEKPEKYAFDVVDPGQSPQSNKRAYVKKDSSKPEKEKRKYTKKIK